MGQLEVFMTQWRRIEAVDLRPLPVHLAYFAQRDAPISPARYPSAMSSAIASLLGALVGGLAAIGGAWLQANARNLRGVVWPLAGLSGLVSGGAGAVGGRGDGGGAGDVL